MQLPRRLLYGSDSSQASYERLQEPAEPTKPTAQTAGRPQQKIVAAHTQRTSAGAEAVGIRDRPNPPPKGHELLGQPHRFKMDCRAAPAARATPQRARFRSSGQKSRRMGPNARGSLRPLMAVARRPRYASRRRPTVSWAKPRCSLGKPARPRGLWMYWWA